MPFALAGIQFFAYLSKPQEFDSSVLLGTALSKFPGRYDGSPQVLPLGADAPPEIPRVQLRSKDAKWGLSGSLLSLVSTFENKSREPMETNKSVEVSEVVSRYIEDAGIQVGRLGVGITRVAQGVGTDELLRRFCKDEVFAANNDDAPLRRSSGFQIANHKIYDLTGVTEEPLKVNSWVRCVAVTSEQQITLTHDFNTLAKMLPTTSFSASDVLSFAKVVADESDSILDKYFPE